MFLLHLCEFLLAVRREFSLFVSAFPVPTREAEHLHSIAIMSHQRNFLHGFVAAAALGLAPVAVAANISNVVETGGDNEATDTITAKWTGQVFPVSVANEPVPGAVIGNNYTVGAFESGSPSFVDRAHRYLDDPGTGGNPAQPIPAYLRGLEYILSGNDNRDNASYRLDITLNSPSIVYLLIDNRLGDANAANPPTFDATHMKWVVDMGFTPTTRGLNRFANTGAPDEVPIDEGADGTVNQYYSVYAKEVPAGTLTIFQADNAGQNMYGVVVQAVPEPGTVALGVLGVASLLFLRRKR